MNIQKEQKLTAVIHGMINSVYISDSREADNNDAC